MIRRDGDWFEKSLVSGKVGEEMFEHWAKQAYPGATILDVRNDPKYREKDVDYIVGKDGHEKWFEVKSDYIAHTTNNFACEMKAPDGDGCMAKTEADLVFYHVVNGSYTFIINIGLLEGFVEYYESRYGKLKQSKMGDGNLGYLIPLDKMVKHFMAKKVFNIKIKEGTIEPVPEYDIDLALNYVSKSERKYRNESL